MHISIYIYTGKSANDIVRRGAHELGALPLHSFLRKRCLSGS